MCILVVVVSETNELKGEYWFILTIVINTIVSETNELKVLLEAMMRDGFRPSIRNK